MWVALKLRTGVTLRASILGMPIEEKNVPIENVESGEVGCLSVYKTKAQAVKHNPKGTPILKLEEVKNGKTAKKS